MKITDITLDNAPTADDLILTVDATTGRNKRVTIGSLPFAGGTSGTNLSTTVDPSTVTVNSDNGTDAIIPAADATNAGVFLPGEKTKLAGVATGATANASNAQLRDRSTHTGTQAASTISDFSEAVDDRVAALIVAGTGITSVYDDTANTLTISSTGGGGGGGQVTVTKTVAPSGGDYTTLQDALAAASAGWTIKLLPGTYSLTADATSATDNITITGSGPSSVIDAGTHTLTTSGQYVTIEKVKITGNGSGGSPLVVNGDHWTLENLWIDARSAYRAFVINGAYGRFLSSLIQTYGHDSAFGFGAYRSVFSDNLVTFEDVGNNGVGFFNSTDGIITNNHFIVSDSASQFNRAAVLFNGDNVTFSNNIYVAATTNGGGISFSGTKLVITGNVLEHVNTSNVFGNIGFGISATGTSGLAIIANNMIPTSNIVGDSNIIIRDNITVDGSGDNTFTMPKARISTDFSAIARYYISLNSATATVVPYGIEVAGSSTNYNGIVREQGSASVPIFDRNPIMTWRVDIGYMSSYASDQYFILGYNNGGTYSWANGAGKYIGFHVNNSFGTITLEGIAGDGTNHSSVVLTPTIGGVNGYSPILTAVMKSGSKVDFYMDGEFLGTLTTNLPTAAPSNGLWAAILYSTASPVGHMGLSHLEIEYDVK